MEGIINGKPGVIGPSYCHNRPRARNGVTVQDGWTADGRRNMVHIPSVNSLECQYSAGFYASADRRCAECEHDKHAKKPKVTRRFTPGADGLLHEVSREKSP